MNALVRKMSAFGILKAQLIIGAIVMAAAMIGMPVAIAVEDASLLLNPFVLGAVIVGMLTFGSFAYFLFIRPYLIYRRSPDVLVETDGEYVYIHGKKEAKIPIGAFAGAVVTHHLPFIYSKELIAGILTYFMSENYGDLILDVPDYGTYRLRFVANVQASANQLTVFLSNAQLPLL